MRTKIYNSFGNIQRVFKRNHLLSAVICINNHISKTYIPITNIRLKQAKPEHNHPKFQLFFDTVDMNLTNVSQLDYHIFLTYMYNIANSGTGYYKRHYIPKQDRKPKYPNFDYITGHFDFTTKMSRHSFTLHGKQFNILQILSANEHTVTILCSPNADRTWLTQIGNSKKRLTKRNLKDIFYLLTRHLLNPITEINIKSNYVNIKDNNPIISASLKANQLHLASKLTDYYFNLRRSKLQFITPSNVNPRLVIIPHNHARVRYIIIFKAKSIQSFLATLRH